MKAMGSKEGIAVLLFSVLVAAALPVTVNAQKNYPVKVTVNSDCTFDVESDSPFDDLYASYWTDDFVKLSEWGERGLVDLNESSFSGNLLLSMMYVDVAPMTGGLGIGFHNLPKDAKSRDDLARLDLRESLKEELTTCFEKLSCPCQFNEYSSDHIEKIYLTPKDENSAESGRCRINIEAGDDSSIRYELETKMSDAISVYSCRIEVDYKAVSEYEFLIKTWDDSCRRQLGEYAKANAGLVQRPGQTDPQSFCPVQ